MKTEDMKAILATVADLMMGWIEAEIA